MIEIDDGSNGLVFLHAADAIEACGRAHAALEEHLKWELDDVYAREKAFYDSRGKMNFIESMIVSVVGAYERLRGRPSDVRDTYLAEIESIWDRYGKDRNVLIELYKKCNTTDMVVLSYNEYAKIMMHVNERRSAIC